MTDLECSVKYDESWKLAKDPSDAPILRTFHEDGTVHFSDLKKLAGGSGRKYLQSVNFPDLPSRSMLIGTAVHRLLLGARVGHEIHYFPGSTRKGKAWDDFRALHPKADILTSPEMQEAQEIAAAVTADPIAMRRLKGARFEIPLTWKMGSIPCSTRGLDIVAADCIADLKTTSTVEPEAWMRHATKMHYAEQMVWYRAGARANGLDVSKGLFVLGVETKAPFEVVELEVTEGVADRAERTITLWLERLQSLLIECPKPRSVKDWPGYAESTVSWELKSWDMAELDESEE